MDLETNNLEMEDPLRKYKKLKLFTKVAKLVVKFFNIFFQGFH